MFFASINSGPTDLAAFLRHPVAALHQNAPGQMTWRERSTALAQALLSPGSVLPSPAYSFASVIVWTEKCYHIWPVYFLYFDGETALAACVFRATTKKGRQLFWGKKCIRVT